MLPVDINHSIFGYLDHISLLKCISTDHHFRKWRSHSILRWSLLNVKPKLPAQFRPRRDSPPEGQQWPCYTCFRLLEWGQFRADIVITMALGATNAGTRACRQCNTTGRKPFNLAKLVRGTGDMRAY